MRQQHTIMKFDPATGEPKPYPSHAEQWREWHGKSTAWLFNPWAGTRRGAGDVGSDPFGFLIRPPGEPVYADRPCVAQNVLLREALRDQLNDCINFDGGKLTTCIMENSAKALAATADLDHLILCEKEPVVFSDRQTEPLFRAARRLE